MKVSGEKIKNCRKQLGLTQVELSKILGITQGTYAQYENGKRNPKIETVKKIADALCVQWTDLCDDVSEHEQKAAAVEYAIRLKEDERIFQLSQKYNVPVEEIEKWAADDFEGLSKFGSNADELIANRMNFLSEDAAKRLYDRVKNLSAAEQLEAEEAVESLLRLDEDGRQCALDMLGKMLLLNDDGQKEAAKRTAELALLDAYAGSIMRGTSTDKKE